MGYLRPAGRRPETQGSTALRRLGLPLPGRSFSDGIANEPAWHAVCTNDQPAIADYYLGDTDEVVWESGDV
jgi:hypothetical protein